MQSRRRKAMSEEEQEKLLKKKKEHRKAIVAKSQRKRREAARRIGMCRICCKNEAAPGRRCCEKCLERSRMTMARKRLYKGCENCRYYSSRKCQKTGEELTMVCDDWKGSDKE